MKNSAFTFLLLIASFLQHANAQKDIPEFGKVTMDELQMTECPFERTAGAMNLLKTAKISFDISGFLATPKLSTEYRVRIKIFDEREFKAASIRIPYVSKSRSTKISDIEAYIFYLDSAGKIVKEQLDKKDMFNENIKAKKALNYVAFTFPNVKRGCVIEYRYTRIDKNSLRVEPWLFQGLLPTAFSSVEAVIPAYLKMKYHVLVSDPIKRDSSEKKYYNSMNNEEIRSFTMRNIRSFRIEPMMSALKNNLQRVEFMLSPAFSAASLFGSNGNLTFYNGLLLHARYFGHQIDKHILETEAFIDSVKRLSGNEAKISSVYNFVRKNIEWNNEYSFFCDSLEECLKNRSGNSADMNLLLVNLLRRAGISCYPLLISTRENGNPDPNFGSLSQFNGVDVYVLADSPAYYIVDCTQKNLSYKIPPFNILNSNTFLVDQKLSGWVFVTDPRILMESNSSVDAILNEDGMVHGNMNIALAGFAKTQTLTEIKNKKNKNDGEKDISNSLVNIVVDSALMLHEKEDNDTLEQHIAFHFTLASTDKLYFLNPFLFSAFKKNPFKDSVRYTDIDFGSNQAYYEKIHIQIPDTFSIESLPQNMVIRLKDSSIFFKREFFSNQSNILIRNSFIIKQAYYDKEDYSTVKTFFDKFYAVLNEDILLKKKS